MLASSLDRRTALAGIAAFPLAGCLGAQIPASGQKLRVATFNIWHDAGGNWPARLPLIVAALRQTRAEIIGLQEVLEDRDRGLANQARTISRALGHGEVHFVSSDVEGAARRFGNAIVSSLPVIEVASTRLEPLSDYRTAIRARVRTTRGPVDVANTHLAWQADAGPVRARQLAHLADWLPRDNVPLIVMGDFNAPLGEPALRAFAGERLVSALPPGAASTTLNPARGHQRRVIDHILVGQSPFAVADARVIGDQPSGDEYPSDHFGVAADLLLR